jgi:hypothetical protein
MSILRYKQKLFADGGVLRMGGGGSGGGGSPQPSTTNVSNSNIPEYARPYVETMLGTAQQQIYNYDDNNTVTGFKPYVPYGATTDAAGNITNTAQEQAGAAIAPFSPLQQQSFRNAGTIGMPGQFNLGTGYQALGGAGALNAGQNYNMMATNPYAQQAFMSPYMQNAVDVQKQEALRSAQTQNIGMNLGAARQGTYGGARQVLAEQERNRNLQTQLGQIQATGTQKAFETAQQAQQYGANLGLQGYGQAVGAGTALGQMGTQQLGAQQGIVNLQNQMGTQQQTQQQNYINQAIQNYAMQQQYPQQQLAFMSGLTRGLPLQTGTTQSYQAAPSAISQLSGLGLTGAAAYGMMKKEGGVIESYADGGTVEDDTKNFVSGGIAQQVTNKVRMNPDGYSKQAIDKSTKSGLVDDLVGLAAIQEKNKNEKERQAAAAMGQPMPPTVKDQILSERAALDQQRGIETAESNLPQEYAGGGIVAFADGGSAFTEDIGKVADWAKEGWSTQKPEWMQKIQGYFTKPRQSPRDADAQPGGLYGSGSNIAPEAAPAAPQDNLTVIRGTPAKTGTGAPAPAAPTMAPTETDAGGIDSLIKQLTGDLKESNKSNADARKEAKLMAMLQAGLGIMGGTSQYAAANFKGAIPALQGYQEEMRGIRGDEAKQIAQLAALNLKGAELKQELKKLGINEQHYRDQAKLMAAQANYYNQRGAATGAGNFGSISSPTALQMMQDYKGALANPTSSPVFKTLDKRTQTFLTKADPSTASYQEAYKVFKNKLDSDFKGDVQFVRAVGNKRSDLSSLE